MIKVIYCCDCCGKELQETTWKDLFESQTVLVDLRDHLICPECAHLIDLELAKFRESLYRKNRIQKKYDILARRANLMFSHPACASCSSNPANGGSGVCACTINTQSVT